MALLRVGARLVIVNALQALQWTDGVLLSCSLWREPLVGA